MCYLKKHWANKLNNLKIVGNKANSEAACEAVGWAQCPYIVQVSSKMQAIVGGVQAQTANCPEKFINLPAKHFELKLS